MNAKVYFKYSHCLMLWSLLLWGAGEGLYAQTVSQDSAQNKSGQSKRNNGVPKDTPKDKKIYKKQKGEEEIKLNEDAIRMIQFDFNPQGEANPKELLEAPIEKKWMKFKEDLSLPRSFTDTTKVKKIEGYIRAEPYTIWTKFGENPVYDVLPNLGKKWEIHWTLNPFGSPKEEYGKSLRPAPGKGYLSAVSMVGPGVVFNVDIDKFLFENLTKRGRMLRHNRKYANAWKTYQEYKPTAEDSAKFPNFYKKLTLAADSTSLLPVYRNDSLAGNESVKKDSLKQPVQPAPKENGIPQMKQEISRFEEYIKTQQQLEKKRREEEKEKRKSRKNAYDIGKDIRKLKESQE